MPLITPFLTPFDYGVIGIVNSYSGIFSLLAVMGLNLHLTNSFYTHKHKFREVWGRILAMLLISGLCFAITYGVIMYFALTQISDIIKLVTIIGTCIPIALVSNITFAQHYYPLVYRPKPLILRNLAASLVGLAVTFVAIYYLKLGFLGWIYGAAISAIVAFVLFANSLWGIEKIKPIWSVSRKRVTKWLKVSFPIIPHSLGFVLLSSSDRIIMGWLGVSIDDIGIYSNGHIMGDYTVIILSALIIAVAPRIQELYRTANFDKLKRLYIFCQVGAIVIAVLLAMWMPQIYHLLVRNEALSPAAWVAFFICFTNIVYPFYSFISTAAFIEERTKMVLWLVFIPATLNIILNFIFIPIYGYKAAVFTTMAAYWSQLFIPYFVGYFKTTTRRMFGNLKLPVILFIVILIITLLTSLAAELNLIYKSIISSVIILCSVIYIIRQKSF